MKASHRRMCNATTPVVTEATPSASWLVPTLCVLASLLLFTIVTLAVDRVPSRRAHRVLEHTGGPHTRPASARRPSPLPVPVPPMFTVVVHPQDVSLTDEGETKV